MKLYGAETVHPTIASQWLTKGFNEIHPAVEVVLIHVQQNANCDSWMDRYTPMKINNTKYVSHFERYINSFKSICPCGC